MCHREGLGGLRPLLNYEEILRGLRPQEHASFSFCCYFHMHSSDKHVVIDAKLGVIRGMAHMFPTTQPLYYSLGGRNCVKIINIESIVLIGDFSLDETFALE